MAMDLIADHGSMHETGVEKIFRDVRLTRIFESNNQINQHPMAQRLKTLGLDNLRPRVVCHSHKLQLRLNAGAVISPGRKQ